VAEAAGIEPTGRGSTRPTRFEDEGGHQTPFTSGASLASRCSIAPRGPTAYDAADLRAAATEGEYPMKKLLIILILAAIGIAVAKKVREA
jgi:hypothetical protein